MARQISTLCKSMIFFKMFSASRTASVSLDAGGPGAATSGNDACNTGRRAAGAGVRQALGGTGTARGGSGAAGGCSSHTQASRTGIQGILI